MVVVDAGPLWWQWTELLTAAGLAALAAAAGLAWWIVQLYRRRAPRPLRHRHRGRPHRRGGSIHDRTEDRPTMPLRPTGPRDHGAHDSRVVAIQVSVAVKTALAALDHHPHNRELLRDIGVRLKDFGEDLITRANPPAP